MISDVLSDAIHEIRHYQREFEAYDDLTPELDDLVARMDAMRDYLDTPGPEADGKLARVRKAAGLPTVGGRQ
jgi:hypothetical protein